MIDRGKPALLTFAAAVLASATAWGQTEYTGHRLPAEPTNDEQYVLELINRARANPQAEAIRLSIPNAGSPDISEGLCSGGNTVVATPPLAINGTLVSVARAHSLDMYTNNYFAHINPFTGDGPDDRMANAGYLVQPSPLAFGELAGENIAVGSSTTIHTAEFLEDFLMDDSGVACRGHRVNLLDFAGTPYYREIGIGYYANAAANPSGWRTFLTQNFGKHNAEPGPFLVGVVYDDTIGATAGFYDPGEGLGGVTVTPSAGGFFAVSSASGGFAVPVGTSGTINVTASGGALAAPITLSVALTGENVKLDFEASTVSDTDGDMMPDAWENANGLNMNDPNDAALDPDGDTFTNLQEFQGGTDPQDPASFPPGDADGDGMTNSWELANGLNPNDPSDASGDLDGDLFTNLEEFQGGSNPNDSTSVPSGDADGDGMENQWEATNGFDPQDPSDAGQDADLDTFTNFEEFLGGSNPNDNTSVPPGDADGDGMDNQWEVANGFDPQDPSDAGQDADLDTFDNLSEFLGGSNPNDNTSVPPGDADGDGMDNQWEVTNGFDPQDPTDASLDPDGDGFTNLEEFQGGSDPNDINSVPPPPPPGKSKSCGSMGVDLLWPLGVLWLARRHRPANRKRA